MAFQCTNGGDIPLDGGASTIADAHHRDVLLERTHSAFGDNYSVKSRSSVSYSTAQREPEQRKRSSSRGRSSSRERSRGRNENEQPEADYDEGATDLYRRIENKDWDGALSRLEKYPYEAMTWVSRREAHSHKTRWRLLPLHAVCIFRAPLALIEALIEVHPLGAQYKDDQGMLPLHLACRNGASKGVVLTLLNAYEESINIKDRKGRYPIDLVQASNSANKDSVLNVLHKFEKEYAESGKEHQRTGSGGGGGGGGGIGGTDKGKYSTAVARAGKSPRGKSPGRAKIVDVDNLMNPSNHSESVNSTPQMANNQGNATATVNTTVNSSIAPQVPQQPAIVLSQPQGTSLTTHTLATTYSGSGGSVQASTQPSQQTNEVDYEHRTVLFRLLLKKEWKPASARAAAFPEEASTWIVTKGFNGNLRFLPLHKACVLQPPEYVVEALIGAFSDGTQHKDQDGWLPLHCACFYGANERVVGTLLKAFSKGAQMKDDEGRLPLHYACLKGAAVGVVDALLEVFPKGAMSKDEEGRLPIHHACGKGAPEGVIDALLKASPKGAQSKDDQGRLALHHACRKAASERIVRTLLRVYPRASQIKDDQDKLPIHYACQHGASAHVISLLLATYPEAVHVQNGFGYTPLGEAKNAAETNPKMESVVRLLEKTKREQDKLKAASGETSDVQAQILLLEEKIQQLDRSLGRVAIIGKEIRHELIKKNKDPRDVLEKFADRLIELGSGYKNQRSSSASSGGSVKGENGNSSEGNNKTPLKTRNSTPIKSLFSRAGGKQSK